MRTTGHRLRNCKLQEYKPRNPNNNSRLVRDNDGFLIPTATAACRPRTGIDVFVEEDERLIISLLSDLIDSLSPVSIFIFII